MEDYYLQMNLFLASCVVSMDVRITRLSQEVLFESFAVTGAPSEILIHFHDRIHH